MFRLLKKGERLDAFLNLPVEEILIRWVNYHLAKAQVPKQVENLNSDVKDGIAYTYLLNQLAPECSLDPLNTTDLLERADQVLANANKLKCRRFLTPTAFVAGNQKLHFAFVANLFNKHHGLEPLSEQEMAGLDAVLFEGEGDKEARVFGLWLNSLNVDPFVRNLYFSCADTLVLLQAMDNISPGCVDWKKVNSKATSKFQKVENCNQVLSIAKNLKLSLVGIQGADIYDQNKKLILGLVWQLCRLHVVKTLEKNGPVTDTDIISWANSKVSGSKKKTSMSSFKDPSLKNSLFLLDLCDTIKPGIVNYDLITSDDTTNAQYVISVARKLGATIFLLPEDIVSVKPKMVYFILM